MHVLGPGSTHIPAVMSLCLVLPCKDAGPPRGRGMNGNRRKTAVAVELSYTEMHARLAVQVYW